MVDGEGLKLIDKNLKIPHIPVLLDEVVEIFKSGGAEKLANELGIPFLGRIPIDPIVVNAGDEGKPCIQYYPESPMAKAFAEIIEKIENQLK